MHKPWANECNFDSYQMGRQGGNCSALVLVHSIGGPSCKVPGSGENARGSTLHSCGIVNVNLVHWSGRWDGRLELVTYKVFLMFGDI